MKKLATLSLILLLTGCAPITKLIDAYQMARWDNNEYMLVNQIHTQAQLGATKCGTKDVVPYVDGVYIKSLELRNYTAGIDHNKESITMSEELLSVTRGLKERYITEEPSQKFCEIKFNTIIKNTEVIKHALGAKPR